MNEHTPPPLHMLGRSIYAQDETTRICTLAETVVKQVSPLYNGRRLVLAYNHHDDLVDALKRIVRTHKSGYNIVSALENAQDVLNAVKL